MLLFEQADLTHREAELRDLTAEVQTWPGMSFIDQSWSKLNEAEGESVAGHLRDKTLEFHAKLRQYRGSCSYGWFEKLTWEQTKTFFESRSCTEPARRRKRPCLSCVVGYEGLVEGTIFSKVTRLIPGSLAVKVISSASMMSSQTIFWQVH
jgi:hypothetical protein